MDAEAVSRRMRQGIDERVDQRSLRRRELRIFTAARIDPEVSPPSSRDTSSAYSPAALTTTRARIDSRSVLRAIPSGWRSAPASLVAGRKMTPPSRRCAAAPSPALPRSTIPLSGDHSAAMAFTAGSRATMKSRRRCRAPRRRCRVRAAGAPRARRFRLSSCATMSLPDRTCGMPWSRRTRTSARVPSTHSRAFSDPAG